MRDRIVLVYKIQQAVLFTGDEETGDGSLSPFLYRAEMRGFFIILFGSMSMPEEQITG